jgi:hypothetical protein
MTYAWEAVTGPVDRVLVSVIADPAFLGMPTD